MSRLSRTFMKFSLPRNIVGFATVLSTLALLGGAPPAMAQQSNGLPDKFLQTYGLSAKQVVRELDFSPLLFDPVGESKKVKAGPQLKKEAAEMLRAGNQRLALELYYAHMVTEYEQAQKEFSFVRFSSALRRPTWQVRWAASMTIRGGTIDEAKPIGGSSDAGEGKGKKASKDLYKALGRVAETVADEFKERSLDGKFGKALRTLAKTSDEPEADDDQASRSGGNGQGSGGNGQGSRGGGQGSGRGGQGSGRGGQGSGRNDQVEEDSEFAESSVLDGAPEPDPIWRTGIVYLGEGTSEDMVEIARNKGYDFLLHFDVSLKTGRNEEIENSSRCRVVTVSDGKVLGVSKGMTKEEAARYSQSGRGGTGKFIKEQLAVVLDAMDQKLKVSQMPELNADIAKRRVGALLSSPRLVGAKKPSLRTLAEIRMYQSLGLLEASEIEEAFDYVGGDEALFLLYGPLDERLDKARQWAIDALPE